MLLAVRFQESMDDWRLESDRLDSVIDIDEREWERANAIAPAGCGRQRAMRLAARSWRGRHLQRTRTSCRQL